MDVNIQNYEYLYELLKIAQNCSENTYTCQKKKSAQNCSKLLKSTYTCPKNLLKIAPNCSNLFKRTYIRPKKIAKKCSKWFKIAQNCLKVLIPAHKNLLKIAQNTCPQNLLKIAQNCSKVLKKYLYLPKKSAQNCLKSTYTCPKNLLKIAQNGSKWLKIAQKCSKCLKMSQNAILRNFEMILRHFETF